VIAAAVIVIYHCTADFCFFFICAQLQKRIAAAIFVTVLPELCTVHYYVLDHFCRLSTLSNVTDCFQQSLLKPVFRDGYECRERQYQWFYFVDIIAVKCLERFTS